MERRGLAHLACRLLAVYLAVDVLASLPTVAATLFAAAKPIAWWSPGLVPEYGSEGVRAAVAAVLWFGARPLSNLIADQWPSPETGRRVSADNLPRVFITATGLFILLGAIGDSAKLVAVLCLWLKGAASDSPLYTSSSLGAGVAIRLALGAFMLVGATHPPRALDWLFNRTAAPKERLEDASVTELLADLVSTAGTLGVRRVADLALAVRAEAEGVAKRMVKSSLDAVIAAVEQQRPDFSAATAADGTVTIVFSDMEGFTAMTQRLGDRKAHAVIKIHNRIVRDAVKAHGGQEVELQGDGFLLAFPQASEAVRCTGAIQRECARYSARHPDQPIRVRIGLHTGKPIKEADRFFGITVILAARIAAQAQGGETLVSAAVYDALSGNDEFEFDAGRDAELKGLDGTHRMYGVLRYGRR